MPFVTDLDLRELGGGQFEVISPLVYVGARDSWEVPVGFKTDGASVPWPFTLFFPRIGGAYTKSAVLHDFHCGLEDLSRKDADGILRRTMRELGVSKMKRYPIYWGVRLYARLSTLPVLGHAMRGLNPTK